MEINMIEYTVRVYSDGNKFWYLNGEYHREDGPAVERADGTKVWYLNGKHHREDGPAIEYADGSKYWYLRGEFVSEGEFNRRMNPPTSKFKIGDKVTAPAYLDAWKICTVIKIDFDGSWPIQCVRSDGTTGVFRENELEFIPYPKELTVKEISELLGYEVKIIRG
jgi:hypothetical protein